MSDRQRGFYKKYNVERLDGKPIKNCVVLEFDDPNARIGISAFSKAVRADGYIKLANNLDTLLQYFEDDLWLRQEIDEDEDE